MALSIESVFTTVVFSSIFILLCSFVFARFAFLRRHGVGLILLCAGVAVFRLLVPLEFGFSKLFLYPHLLPPVFGLMRSEVISLCGQSIRLMHALFAVWMLVAVINLFRLRRRYLSQRRALSSLPACRDEALLQTAKEQLACLGYQRRVEIKVSDAAHSPFLFGFFRPMLVLTTASLSLEEWKYVLWHEIIHLKRGDLWYKLALEITRGIYWWNPCMNLLRKNVCKALEMRADQSVSAALSESEKIAYAECLIKVAKGRAAHPAYSLSLPFDSVSKSTLFQRFHLIFSEKERMRGVKRWGEALLTLGVTVLFGLSTYMIVGARMSPPPGSGETFVLTPEHFYLVAAEEGLYDVYRDGALFAPAKEYHESFDPLMIYLTEEEVPENGPWKKKR